jgi:predicted  nucleic acid-binding Zn-ribbon protein
MHEEDDESPIEHARRRLDAAIDALESAVHLRVERDGRRESLEVQLQAFGSDRSRLAAELDQIRGRSGELEDANREVSRRLERAVDTIRTVLGAEDR